MIKLYRPKRFLNIGRVAAAIRLAFGLFFLSLYWSSGSFYWLAAGVVWPLSLVFNIFRTAEPKVAFEETSDGFVSMEGGAKSWVQWDQIVAVARGMEVHGKHFIVWRENVDGKDEFAVVTVRGVGEDGFRKVGELIKSKRPNLPDFLGGKVQNQ